MLFFALQCAGQSAPMTELYGPVTAVQVFHSLGTNISASNEWEYQAAQAAHMTWGRFDCPWQSVERQQLPGNTSGGYALPAACASGLSYSRTYGVHPIVDALYGAPYGKVATAVTTENSPVGSTRIGLRTTSGSLSSVDPGQSYLKMGTGNVSSKHAYAGTLIMARTNDSVTLASALTTNIPAGSTVALNLQLYAPVLIPPGGNYLSNPSIRAFGSYVHFLETEVAASGISGRVSIWNEPPWGGDPWDEAANLYDNPPAENRMRSKFGVELAYFAATLPPVAGVMLDNGYTNKSGGGSILHPDRLANLRSPAALHQTFASESFHPYGNNPEDAAWIPSCVATHGTPQSYGQVFKDCTPVGMVQGANAKWEAAFNASSSFSGLDLGITETGICRCSKPSPSEDQISRFDLRQFLVFAGSGVHPIVFYRLQDPGFGWLRADHSPYPVYTAFKNVMADMETIARPPVAAYPACTIPRVESYAGQYPLAAAILVGSRAGDRANSVLMYTWQRSYSAGAWLSLASPAEGNVSIVVPVGLRVMSVKDTVSSSAIPFRVNEGLLSYRVADNPVQIMMMPASAAVTPPVCR